MRAALLVLYKDVTAAARLGMQQVIAAEMEAGGRSEASCLQLAAGPSEIWRLMCCFWSHHGDHD